MDDTQRQEILENTRNFVKKELQNAEGGHDWSHIERVVRNSRAIASVEGANSFIVELGALLHDIADSKFHDGDETVGPVVARRFLEQQGLEEAIIQHVEQIIRFISFKGGTENSGFSSPEFFVVQDADRLDALGAIGIARAFNYGGFKNRPLYDPTVPPKKKMSREEYKKSTAPTINHFYEKLFLLKDRMNTRKGREMAEHRHEFMQEFLKEFYKEWDEYPDNL